MTIVRDKRNIPVALNQEQSLGQLVSEAQGARLEHHIEEIEALGKKLNETSANKTYPLLNTILRRINSQFPSGSEERAQLRPLLKIVRKAVQDSAQLTFEELGVDALHKLRDEFNKNRAPLREALNEVITVLKDRRAAQLTIAREYQLQSDLVKILRGARANAGAAHWDHEARHIGASLLGAAIVRLTAEKMGIPLEQVLISEKDPRNKFIEIARRLPLNLAWKILGQESEPTLEEETPPEAPSIDLNDHIRELPKSVELPRTCKSIVDAVLESSDRVTRSGQLAEHTGLSVSYLHLLIGKAYKAFGLSELPNSQKFSTLRAILKHSDCPHIRYSKGRESEYSDSEELSTDNFRVRFPFSLIQGQRSVTLRLHDSEYTVPMVFDDASVEQTGYRRMRILRALGYQEENVPTLKDSALRGWCGERLVELYRNSDPSNTRVIFDEFLHTSFLVAVRMPSIKKLIAVSPEAFISATFLAVENALKKFDPKKGQVDSFILGEIRYHMLEHLRSENPLSRTVYEKLKEVEEITALGSDPRTTKDNLQRAGYDEDVLRKLSLQRAAAYSSSYDAPLSDEGESTLDDISLGTYPWDINEEGDPLISTEERMKTAEALDWLSEEYPREHFVISQYTTDEVTFKDLAGELGISESRVYQIYNRGVKLIQQYIGARTEMLAGS